MTKIRLTEGIELEFNPTDDDIDVREVINESLQSGCGFTIHDETGKQTFINPKHIIYVDLE